MNNTIINANPIPIPTDSILLLMELISASYFFSIQPYTQKRQNT